MKTKAQWSDLWDSAEAVLTEKFIVIQCYLKERKIKQPNLTPKQLEKKKTNKQNPKLVDGKEIIIRRNK